MYIKKMYMVLLFKEPLLVFQLNFNFTYQISYVDFWYFETFCNNRESNSSVFKWINLKKIIIHTLKSNIVVSWLFI